MEPPSYSPVAGPSNSRGSSVSRSSSASRPIPSRQASDAIAKIPSFSSLSSLSPDHPVHVSLGKNLDLKKDSIRVGLVECDIVISPGATPILGTRPTGTEGSGRINGYVQVVSTSVRKIQGIRVRLVRRMKLAFPDDHGLEEEDEVVEKELILGQPEGITLQKGISTFEFRFGISSTSSVHDDTAFAKIEHWIAARVIGSAKGWFDRDLRCEEELWIIPAPATGEAESQGLSIHSQGVTEALGPFSFDLNASAFIVASALDIGITLHCPPPNLTVYGIKIYLAQQAVLTSFRHPGKTATIYPPRQFIIDLGPPGPYKDDFVKKYRGMGLMDGTKQNGQEWSFDKVARLPSDRRIRPSTHPTTETWVRMSCELVIDIVYTTTDFDAPNSPESRKVWVATVFSKPVSLGSCGCFVDRLCLPDYTERAGHSFELAKVYNKDHCLCLQPWDDVEKEELRGRASSPGGTRRTQSHSRDPQRSSSKSQGRKPAETFEGDLDSPFHFGDDP